MKLRDYQQQLIRDVYSHFKAGKRRCLVFAPTGAGKSIIICKLVMDALSKNRRILIVVHRTKLAQQLSESIELFCNTKPSLIFPGGESDYSKPVQIAMAQTLNRRELPDNIDVLIGDEIHQTGYFDIWTQCLDKYLGSIWSLNKKCFVVGLTATPWRTKAKEGFCHLFDCKAYAPSPRKLIESGYLTYPRLFSYKLLDTALLKVDSSEDYSLKSIAIACNEEYNKDVVEKWHNLCPEKKTIVFASTVKRATHLNEVFKSKGIKSEIITGSTSEKDRQGVFDRFKAGETQVLVSVGTLTEGYDETSIECVLIARPTRSQALLTQIVGRGLRLHQGKNEVFVIDCGECFSWLMSKKVDDPIDLHQFSLCPSFKKKGEVPTKECVSCGEEIPVFARICPHCGTLVPLKTKEKPSDPKFPQLEEILTTTTLKHYKWLRKEISKCFESKTNPENIFNDFHRKFGYLPPKDYFLGSIFDLRECEQAEAYYSKHLRQLGCNEPLVKFFLDLEFGEPGRKYQIKGLDGYTRQIKQTIAA